MENIIKIFRRTLPLLLLIMAASCKKVLDTVPKDFLSPINYYQTEAELNTALTGVYDVMGDQGLYGQYWWNQINGGTDIEWWRNNGTQPATTQPNIYNANSSDAFITQAWNMLYTGINRSNSLLDAIDAAPVDSTAKRPIKAQALFLRGYYYFLLVSNWGGVPLRLHATSTVSDADLARSSIAEVYAQVLADMEAAETNLPDIGSSGSGRVSKTAAEGILARVCLYMAGYPLQDVSKYQAAKDWALKVINSGAHSLNADYRQIFINLESDQYDTKESIWEVEFKLDPTNAHKEYSSLGYANGVKCNDETYGFCRNDNCVTRKAYDLANATANDLRRDWNTAPFTLGGTWPNVVKAPITSTSNYNLWNRSAGKFRREFEVVTPKNKTLAGCNFPILRYADVLLMFAEAENELNGPTADAYAAINQVRQRAQGTGYRISGFTITNGGSGYTAAPTVAIASPTLGNGATATATVSGGKITALALSATGAGGAFYTAAPAITFSGGGGTGAVITPTMQAITPASANLPTGLTKDDFRTRVQNERAVELSQEALRKGDLIRWNMLISALQSLANDPNISNATNPVFNYAGLSGRNITSAWTRLPVPISEITLNKSFGGQNPGF